VITADKLQPLSAVKIGAQFQVSSSATSYAIEVNPSPVWMRTSQCSWSQPANMPLSGDEVHLWYSSLDLPASSFQRLGATLDADERERTKGLCFDLERARFVVSHGLLRRILGHYSGVEPNKLRFLYSTRGKPSLTEEFGERRIQFSLSHSDGYVIYAFTLDHRIGIDLEHVVPIVESERIAARFFSGKEKAVLDTLAGNERREAFFRIWTAKEAYLKACGQGLAFPLNRIETIIDREGSICSLGIKGIEDDSRWSLEQFGPAPGFVASLIIEGSNFRVCRYSAQVDAST